MISGFFFPAPPFFLHTHTQRKLAFKFPELKKKSLEVSYYIKPQLLLLNPWGRDSNLIVLFWGQVSSNEEKLSILLNYRQVLKVISFNVFGVGAKPRASHMLCIRFDICVLHLQSLDFNNALTIASTTMYCLWISVLYDRSILVQWECRAGSPTCTNQLTNRPPKTQHKGLWVGPLMAPKQKTR